MLLLIDEIGCIPMDRQGANLFFQLISRRYERGSILLTSNQSLGAWGEVFWGHGDRQRDSRPAPAPRHHDQHQRRVLSLERETPGRAAPPRPDG
jgi:DNA replication protein DnaC